MKLIIKYKLYLFAILFFTFYLITLPYFNQLLIPCLKPIPQTSYSDSDCNLNSALDRFMMMSLTGFIIFGGVIFIFGKRKDYLPLIFTMTIFTGLIIGNYLNYIKTAEKLIRHAPIILEKK